MPHGCRTVHSVEPWWSLGSFGAPWGSSGSFGFVGFILVRHGGGWVHSGSLGSFSRALVVVRFIRVRCIYSGARCGSSCSFRFVAFSLAHGRVNSSSFWHILGVVGFIRLTCVHSGVTWIHSCSLSSYGRALVVVGFSRILSGALCGSSGSFRFVVFSQARSGCGWFNSTSLGSFWRVLGVLGFIRLHWVHFGRDLVVVGFIRVRWVHSRTLRYVSFIWDIWLCSGEPLVSWGPP